MQIVLAIFQILERSKRINCYRGRIYCTLCLKGVWHEIFSSCCSQISIPHDPEYSTGAVLTFYENSRIYSKNKGGVHDAGDKWEKFGDRNFFHIILEPIGLQYTIIIIERFFTQRSFQSVGDWYSSNSFMAGVVDMVLN